MSFLNRMMASIGVGGAKVDTLLHNARVAAGEQVTGVVRVQGGSLDQQVDGLSLHLMTQYLREVNDRRVRETGTLASFRVTGGFALRAGETREIPFAYTLPEDTPATIGQTRVWLHTGLDVPAAVDPTDDDALQVLPHRHAQVVLDALGQLGFALRHVEVEYSRRLGRSFPLIQEFEFVPTTQFRGRLDELEVVLYPHAGGVEVRMEVDRRARGFGGFLEEALGADETHMRVAFGLDHLQTGVQGVAGYLHDIIARHSR